MLSIENLAWKSSNRPGFTIQDLPFSERGPNGGRVMWFPPYDLKFDDYMECANYCSKILSSFKNSVKYIGIFKNDNLISVLIRPGFHPYNYEDFKKFDKL